MAEYTFLDDKCKKCLHSHACEAWVRHGAALYDDFHYSVEDCPYYEHSAHLDQVKHGRWVHVGGDEWCCSWCGHVITTDGRWETPLAKFCEECGADMRGKKCE